MNNKALYIVIKAKNEASKAFKEVNADSDKMAAGIKSAAGTAVAAGIAIAAALGIKAVNSAGEFESSLSRLKQASSATGKEMGQMSALARKLGEDNTLAGVTAADAASTMIELSKAGLSVNDTMAASKGVMSLAKAGQLEYADAATLAASALNAFGLRGKDANKVADALAAGANASQANLSDLGEGLQQSATVAKQFGLSLNETVTALSLFANNGIRGSDAGTSLKTMLISLAKPSEKAADLMKEIGFSAYDSEGSFVGLEKMSDRLRKALAGMTKEQKQNALATIFGTDAFRAAAVLSDNAGKSYDKMAKSVGKAGAAQEAAAAQLGPYQKMLEGLSNTFSEIGLRIGTKALPAITQIGNAVRANAVPAFESLSSLLQGQSPLFTTLAASTASYYAITSAVTMGTKAWTAAQVILNNAMRANPIILVTSLIVGLGLAYASIVGKSDSAKSATDRLKLAREALTTATNNAKSAENRLRDAHLSSQEASLRVERAQRTYTDAVKQYGPKSLEAREAEVQLKRARQDNANATASLRDRTNEARDANDKLARQKELFKKANYEISASAQAAAGSYRSVADAIKAANAEGAKKGASAGNSATKNVFNTPKLPGRATGGPVTRGKPYIVGENEPELFVPKQSGQIMNQKQMREAGITGGSTFNMYGNNYFGDAGAVDRYFDRINAQSELASYGAGA